MDKSKVVELYNKERERFISLRSKREAEIQEFFNVIDKMQTNNPELLANVTIPEGRTAEELFPSLYHEEVDRDAFKQEDAAFQLFVDAVNGVLEPYYTEAYQLLNEGVMVQ